MTFCHAQGIEAGNECSPLFWHLQNSVPGRAPYGTEGTQMPGERGPFPYSTIGKFLTNAREKRPLPHTAPSANSPQMPGERSLPQTALPEIQQTPQKGLFPYSTTGKFLAAALLWQQGIIYSGGGVRTHGFIPAAVHARMDLTIF